MKLCQNDIFHKSRSSFKLGHVGLKSRSLGQNLKNCVHYRGHSFDQTFKNFVSILILINSRSGLKVDYIG